MNAVKEKLKSRRGVSILYALLLFLVCAFVATATLTAAYHSAARSTQAQKEQQAYLAVASAAELIKDAVDGKSMAMNYIKTTEEIKDEAGNVIDTVTHYSTEVATAYEGSLSEVETLVYGLFQKEKMGSTPPATLTYELTFALDGHEALENVAGELTVDEASYSITVLLYNKDSHGNAMRMNCWASKSVSGNTTQTTSVTWSDAEIAPTTISS